MVRGPRRGNPTSDRRIQRKLDKIHANSHGGNAGQSLLELLEDAGLEAARQYVTIRDNLDPDSGESSTDRRRAAEAQGRVKGLAISVAMIRHPLRRYEVVWWNYVTKKSKEWVAVARDEKDDDAEADAS